MIDNLAILFSTVMVLVALFRAVKLDASEPWFKPRRDRPDDAAASRPTPPWRR